MRIHAILLVGASFIVASSISFAVPASAAQLNAAAPTTQKPQITMEQAKDTALRRVPGNIKSSELEHEHGRFIYSFDIGNRKGIITEVQVSAITGKVVSVTKESAQREAAEQRKESHERARSNHGM